MTDTAGGSCGLDGLGGWEAVGIPMVEAQAWARAGYAPNDARAWHDAGALDPATAVDWERSGFTPTTAELWMAIGEIGPADAITMSEAGMTPADCARIGSRDPLCQAFVAEVREPPAVDF